MKIDNLTIRGFRGFNQEKTIELHPTITLIYGLNSYGKTSITEAAEWLLYGKTSKVDRGESKDEYKGSYRNCHIEAKLSTNVKAFFISEGKPIIYEAELIGDDGVIRHLDGNPIEQWPINSELAAVSNYYATCNEVFTFS